MLLRFYPNLINNNEICDISKNIEKKSLDLIDKLDEPNNSNCPDESYTLCEIYNPEIRRQNNLKKTKDIKLKDLYESDDSDDSDEVLIKKKK